MFTLPEKPYARSKPHELADFVELHCLKKRRFSIVELTGIFKREADEADEPSEGCEDAEHYMLDKADEVINVIEQRAEECGAYPFKVISPGYIIERKTSTEQTSGSVIYSYLLMATRLNMNTEKKQREIDATKKLEELGAHVIQEYLGGKEHARSIVFGTASKSKFPERIKHLIQELGENTSYFDRHGIGQDAQDGTLDVVGWIPFSDSKAGKVIVFVQCKTGTHWREATTKTRPKLFSKNFFSDELPVEPLRAYCIADSVIVDEWGRRTAEAGILFDRCRIVNLCSNIPDELFEPIKTWAEAAILVVKDHLEYRIS